MSGDYYIVVIHSSPPLPRLSLAEVSRYNTAEDAYVVAKALCQSNSVQSVDVLHVLHVLTTHNTQWSTPITMAD